MSDCDRFFGLHWLIIDLSLAVFLRCTLQHAVQEAQRYAITSRFDPALGERCSIKKVVKRQCMGFLSDADMAKVQIQFYDHDLNLITNPTIGFADGNLIEISVNNFVWRPILPVLLFPTDSSLTMTARSNGRIEPLPGGVAPPWGGGSCL